MKTIYKNALVNSSLTDLVTENGKITYIGKIEESGIDLGGCKVIPGLIDIHTHGCAGVDTMDNKLEEMSICHAKHGVTSYCPTTMTAMLDDLAKLTDVDTSKIPGASILGFHLEGPYINSDYKGAQNGKYIQSPDYKSFSQIKNVSMVTVAPEVEGAMDFIKQCECIVSLGHTGADYDTAIKAIENGANCLTHTFNAMPPLHHRNPSVIGAAIMKNIYIQVICDGLHIHPAVILMLYKTFGAERMIAISDSMRATGLADGKYELGGQEVFVNGKEARLADGTIAGSVTPLITAVKNLIDWGIPEEDALQMASTTPAQLLNVNKGKLEVGYDADFVVVDNEFNVLKTIINGNIFCE